MKLVAMESLYEGTSDAPLSVIGIVNFDKTRADWASDKEDFIFDIKIPYFPFFPLLQRHTQLCPRHQGYYRRGLYDA